MTNLAKLGLVVTAAAALLVLPATASADPNGKAGPGGGSSAASGKRLGVKRLVLAHGIDGREPQDAASTFKITDDRVYAFVELENPGKTGDTITVVFEPPSGSNVPSVIEIPLAVGDSARFRTWAYTRKAHAAGEWTVVIRDGQHRVLGRQTFTVS